MSIIPTKWYTWSQQTVETNSADPMAMHLAIQPLIQNQVDQILKEIRQRRWSGWKCEDLREERFSVRKTRKTKLLTSCPGLLSSQHSVTLREDSWAPIYILSASIPHAQLQTSYNSDLQVWNVLWQHKTSDLFSITLYNNHVDPSATFEHLVSDGLSTNRSSEWAVGNKGNGFIRACHYIASALRPTIAKQADLVKPIGLSVRVGHIVGDFAWHRKLAMDPEGLALSLQDLTPLSYRDVEGRPDFRFPFDEGRKPNTLTPSPKARISAIYYRRFLFNLSEPRNQHLQAHQPTEPGHERSVAQPDEVLVTICNIQSPMTPEYIFSAVYGIFPPQTEWAIESHTQQSPSIIFYLLTGHTKGFYYRDYLLPLAPKLNRVGVNYLGDLDLSPSSLGVQITGELFNAYRKKLSVALHTAIRTIPALAVELAHDILTESPTLPDTFGRILNLSCSVRTDAPEDADSSAAYRRAFESAWVRIDAALAEDEARLYPYASGRDTTRQDIHLIAHLGMHPVPVEPYVKVILEKAGAYPPIKTYAESLLLNARGAATEPPGTDIVRTVLLELFPGNVATNPLSVREYNHEYPYIVWSGDTRTFAMSASMRCRCGSSPGHPIDDTVDEESSSRRTDPNLKPSEEDEDPNCLCWVGIALQAAVRSWQSKQTQSAEANAAMTPPVGERLFHVLLKCTIRALRTKDTSVLMPQLPHFDRQVEGADDDSELEYLDPVAQAIPARTPATPSPAKPAAGMSTSYPTPVSTAPWRTHARLWAHANNANTPTSISPSPATAAGSRSSALPTSGSKRALSTIFQEWDVMARVFGQMSHSILNMKQVAESVVADEFAHSAQDTSALRELNAQQAKKLAALQLELRAKDNGLREAEREKADKEEKVQSLEAEVHRLEEKVRKLKDKATRAYQDFFRDDSVGPNLGVPFDDGDGVQIRKKRMRMST